VDVWKKNSSWIHAGIPVACGYWRVAYRSITGLPTPVTGLLIPTRYWSTLPDAQHNKGRGDRTAWLHITGDEAFLSSYQAALDNIPRVVKELRTLTADNPNQQKRLDELGPLIAGKAGVP